MESRDEFADAVRARLSGYGLTTAAQTPAEAGDLTPPWVAEEVRTAQAFIDGAWAEHVHDTEHVLAPDWQLGPEVILYNSLGGIVIAHIECRYCRIDAHQRRLKGLLWPSRHGSHTCEPGK